MSELNSGMSEIRKFVRALETIEKAIKNLIENGKDKAHYKAFFDKLEQANPKHPVMNDTNAAFYDVTGVGPKKMQELFDGIKVPNASFIEPRTGTTVIAIPKQYERQANIMLAKTSELRVTVGQRLPADMTVIKKMTANMTQTPSALVINSMQNGTAVTKTFDSGRWIPLAQQMEDASIPFAVVKNSKEGTTTLIFDQQCALSVHFKDEAIEKSKAPAELTYADFMHQNLGKEIVEHGGLTEGQIREWREEMRGAGAGYNVQKQQDGTYTVRYDKAQAPYLTPAMTSVIVRSNGVNDKGKPVHAAMDSHAHYVSAQAEQAHSMVSQQQNIIIIDATTGTQQQGFLNKYTVNDKGLSGPDGKLIVRRDDPKFAETVHSVTSQMKAPVVKAAGPDGKLDENLFTKSEIAAAKTSHAEATPSDASIVTSQLATMKVTTALAQPNASIAQVLNDATAFCQTLSNSIEEETFRLDPEELNNHPSLYGAVKPEKLIEFEDTVHKLSAEEKSTLSDGLRKTSPELSRASARRIEQQDLSLDEIGDRLDGELGHDTTDERAIGNEPAAENDVISLEGV